MNNPEGRPLPPKPGIEQFPQDPRREREMVPTKGTEHVDFWQGSKQTAADAGVRKARADQYADFFRRRFGRKPTDAEVAEGLGEGGQQ